MSFTFKKNTEGINWVQVNRLLNGFGLTHDMPDETEYAFTHSAVVAFVLNGEQVIGCGRALSDGIAQAAIYNIAVDEAYHDNKLGTKIIQMLLEDCKKCNVILYTHPKTVKWYEKLGFRRMKTGMVLYHPDNIEEMEQMDFI
ncbi:GNAT family N-acetyltransferase [Lachnospiraceae bacterium ZAX-1]